MLHVMPMERVVVDGEEQHFPQRDRANGSMGHLETVQFALAPMLGSVNQALVGSSQL